MATAMNSFASELSRRLEKIREDGLYRELRRVDSPQSSRIRVADRMLLNFSSNDYLGLANHPLVNEAAVKAVECFGSGSGASRLICGSMAPHHELEIALAGFKKAEAALCFSSGYAAALGTIGALAGKDDVIVLDKLVHACIVDAARLSGAKLRVFAHNDLDELRDILRWASQRLETDSAGKHPSALIITESVFSMDGDQAPLREIIKLKEQYCAWLMVDEAHATGLFGKHRRGLAEELNVADQIEIQMGTLGKALGSSGGYICGTLVLIDYLINRARTFIFSTAPTPASAAAARAAIELVQTAEGESRCKQLWSLVEGAKAGLTQAGWTLPAGQSAIMPLMIGEETKAVETAATLRECGVFIPAVRYPTIARGQARLRLTVTASHTTQDLEDLFTALATAARHTQHDTSPHA